ncbi:MAG: response regulator, partial [Planctomycetota bacterium]
DEAVRAFESERYDVILMDMMMPVLSGSDACRRIRASENPRRGLPIVACSAAVFDADRQEAHDAGMDDFLAKPIRLEELRAVLAKQVDGTTPTSPPDPS